MPAVTLLVNQAIRIIQYNVRRSNQWDAGEQELGWLTFKEEVERDTMVFQYKFDYCLTPKYVQYLPRFNEVHNYNTRHSNDFMLRLRSTLRSQRVIVIFHLGASNNNISTTVKSVKKTEAKFKEAFKKEILQMRQTVTELLADELTNS